MRFLIAAGLACSTSYGPALLLKLGHPAFSKRSTSSTSTYTSDKRYHVLLGLAGSCPPLSLWVIAIVFAGSSLCLQQQPSASLGVAPSCARAHLQHTTLSSSSTTESCRYRTVVFIEKQTLGMAKAISSKLERDVLEVPFSLCGCKSGWRKSHQKTAGEKCEIVVCENLPKALSFRGCWVCRNW